MSTKKECVIAEFGMGVHGFGIFNGGESSSIGKHLYFLICRYYCSSFNLWRMSKIKCFGSFITQGACR